MPTCAYKKKERTALSLFPLSLGSVSHPKRAASRLQQRLITHSFIRSPPDTHTHTHTYKTFNTQVKQCSREFFSPLPPLLYKAVSMATSSGFWHRKVETCRKYERPPGSWQEDGWRTGSVVIGGGRSVKELGYGRGAAATEMPCGVNSSLGGDQSLTLNFSEGMNMLSAILSTRRPAGPSLS